MLRPAGLDESHRCARLLEAFTMDGRDVFEVAGLKCSQRSGGAQEFGDHVLLLGICGAGMRALAEILLDQGIRVSGTDIQLESDADVRQVRQHWDHPRLTLCRWGEVCPPMPSIGSLHRHFGSDSAISSVVVSAAVSSDNPVVRIALRQGLCCMGLSSALARLFADQRQFCIAGTHGKTTTAGMLWWILDGLKKQPSGFVGGQLINNQRSGFFRSPENGDAVSVIESCEYRGSFLELSPQTVILTGIDSDHFDCYPTSEDENRAFERFVSRLPSDGLLLFNGDCPRSGLVATGRAGSRTSFGLTRECDWYAGNFRSSVNFRIADNRPGNSSATDCLSQVFDVFHRGTLMGVVKLRIPGLHNVRNSLAALACVVEAGHDFEQAAAAVGEFQGIRRRFERRQSYRSIEMIDDYAHHPGAIVATISAARAAFPDRRLVVVFEPHQVSRTQRLFELICRSLRAADECLILPVLAAREQVALDVRQQLSGDIVRRINRDGGRAFLFPDLDQVIARIDHACRPGDVLLTMGAGRTNQIHDEFNRRLQRDFAA